MGSLLVTLQQHPAGKLPKAFSPLNLHQEGKMSAVLEAAANQHAHHVLAAWLGTCKIALQVQCCLVTVPCSAIVKGPATIQLKG